MVKDSALEAMFSGRHALNFHNDKVFVDRDPETFTSVINYIGNGSKVLPKLDSEQ